MNLIQWQIDIYIYYYPLNNKRQDKYEGMKSYDCDMDSIQI